MSDRTVDKDGKLIKYDKECYDCGHLQSQHDDDLDACEWDCNVEGCGCDCFNGGCFICGCNHPIVAHKIYKEGFETGFGKGHVEGMRIGTEQTLKAIEEKEKTERSKNFWNAVSRPYVLTGKDVTRFLEDMSKEEKCPNPEKAKFLRECHEIYLKQNETEKKSLANDNFAWQLIGLSEDFYMNCQQVRETGEGDEQKIRVSWREAIKAMIKKEESK